MVDIAMLGTGGGMPMVERYLSAALINFKGRKILVDSGEGTQVSMRILGWGFKSIDVICITHSHGDHIVGLPGLLGTIGNSGREEPIIILGPRGIKNVIERLRVICPYLPYELIIIENPHNIKLSVNKNKMNFEDIFEGDIIINSIELDHSSPCIGYNFIINRKPKFDVKKAEENNVPKKLWSTLQKVESVKEDNIVYTKEMVLGDRRKGIKISYITDSRPIKEIINFISRSDLFICEGTYGNNEDIEKAIKNKHMTFSEAAILAKEGVVKELLLTHFSPSLIEPETYLINATSIFYNTVVAYDRIIKTIKFTD
ncbi:Ribonuclease Z [uncultured Clostridium sp.]|uniref:ribonuclease Z n=1 Tax=uncultured Clostridium sp. TaxID=59620 RepID=UPI00082338A1|nr:ribonuclease Z [uncultured Clostridium sp.]SCJ98813.1 Ribonuclease Z [uncultured Clostridium sp.]